MVTTGSAKPDSPAVSKRPLLTEQITLAGMWPPLCRHQADQPACDNPSTLPASASCSTGASSGMRRDQMPGLHRAVVLPSRAVRSAGCGGGTGSPATAARRCRSPRDPSTWKRRRKRIGGRHPIVNNAGRNDPRPLAESLERWHDVELHSLCPAVLSAGLHLDARNAATVISMSPPGACAN